MGSLNYNLDSANINTEVVQLEELGNGVVQITMKDEENCNTFSPGIIEGLYKCFDAVTQNKSYKVVILTGYGNYFCSGGTKKELISFHKREIKMNDFSFFRIALDCEIPVIAAMQGHAIGVGLLLGLYADLVVLSKESIYTANFMRYGFTPGMGGTFILPKKLGFALGQEMMYTAKNYRGEELVKRGVSYPVLPRTEVLNFAIDTANEIAEKPRLSLITLKNHLTSRIKKELSEFIDEELAMHEITFHQPEVGSRIERIFSETTIMSGKSHNQYQNIQNQEILHQLQSGDISLETAEQLLSGFSNKEEPKATNINSENSEEILSLLSTGEISLENAEDLLLREEVEPELQKQTNRKNSVPNEMGNHEGILNQLQSGNISIENAEQLLLGFNGEKLKDKKTTKQLTNQSKEKPINYDNSNELLSGLITEELSLEKPENLLLEELESPNKINRLSYTHKTIKTTTDIAIIGLSCRYPGAKNWQEFWVNLKNGVDSVTEPPPGRWEEKKWYHPDPAHPGTSYSKCAGFLDEIDKFDPLFFEISPAEAQFMEPQQRVFLENAYHAIEDAGYAPDSLKGKQCGVFVGATNSDYSKLLSDSGLGTNRLALTGNLLSIVPARIAYFLDLRGPVVAVDTACSSSLVAIHKACESIQRGESEMAIAGGIVIMATADAQILSSQFQMLSTTGRCNTFDASASGTVWSEGCGVVFLKSYEQAIHDNDHIYGVIKGTGMNYDGNTNGISAPSSQSQIRLEEEVYQKFGINPETISYVEAHGTATPLGDPIEVEALTETFSKWTHKKQFCAIGSVKTNIGHPSYAAGIAGLIKTILCLKNQKLVPSLHFNQPNPHIDFENSPFYVNTEFKDWEVPDDKPRRAAVSSFGFSGTNAHVVVEEASLPVKSLTPLAHLNKGGKSKVKTENNLERSLHLLTLSAKCEKALQELAQRYQEFLGNNSTAAIADICFTANTGRSHFKHRLAVVAESTEKLAQQLNEFETGVDTPGVVRAPVSSQKPPKIVVLFTGQGSQYVDMGRELYSTQPTFRKTLEQCDGILRAYQQKSLLSVLYPEPGETSPINETAYTQPALFAIEYALFELWQSWGIEPDVVMGHSVGEYVAACVAGVFSLEDGLKLIAHRGRLMQQLPSGGEMVAVMASFEKVNQLIAPYTETVAIAAINGPESVVISGAAEAIKTVTDSLEAEGIKTKQLQVSHAFHSPLMEPMLAEFEAVASQISYNQPRIPLISNVTGAIAPESIATASYWVNHVRQPVKFAQSMETLHQQGYEVFLEIGSKPILLGMARQCLPEDVGVWLPSVRPSQEDWQVLLHSLAQLYVQGVKVDWSGFDRDYSRSKVVLPTYPFQQQRYWIETDNNLIHKKQFLSNPENLHPLLGQRLHLAGLEEQIRFECLLSPSQPTYLKHHCVFSVPVLPATVYLEIALAAGSTLFKSDNLILEDIVIRQALILPEDEVKTIQLVLTPQETLSYSFQIFSLDLESSKSEPKWTLHVQGKLLAGEKNVELETTDLKTLIGEYNQQISPQDFYQKYRNRGIDYGYCFQAVQQLWSSEGKALGKIELPETLVKEATFYQLHPVLLDASFQVLASALGETVTPETYLAVAIKRLKVYRSSSTCLWSQVEMDANQEDNSQTLEGKVRLLSDEGKLIATVEGLTVKRATAQAIVGRKQESVQDWLYKVEWRTKVRFGKQLSANYLPTPDEIDLKLRPQVTDLISQPDLEVYKKALTQLETLSIDYVLNAFQELGWEFVVGESFSTEFIVQKLGVVQPHQRLLGRLLEMLSDVGILKPLNGEWQVTQVPLVQHPQQRFSSLLSQYPTATAELTLLQRCASQLASVLRGESDPVQLVFPQGDLTTTTQLYQESPGAKVMNTLVQQAVLSALEQLPKSCGVRVLEIGAGTGGTTAHVLPHLNPAQTEYVFTDLGALFTTKAQEKFGDYPFVRYQTLDIEKDPSSQGFEEHQYDLIIAANVLHATQDLRQTLQHIQQLLAPGGMLVLLEGTTRQRWLDLIFGLLEGWWRFTDVDLRQNYPLLSVKGWQQLLIDTGFKQAVSIPDIQETNGALSEQAVILAQADDTTLSNTKSEQTGHWLILAEDTTVVGENLAQQLQQQGYECSLVYRGDRYQKLEKGVYQLNPTEPEGFQRLIQAIGENSKFPLQKVIHLWGLDAPTPKDLTITSLEQAQPWGCGTVLHLVKALIKTNSLPQLWLVTRGAQSVLSQTEEVSVAASPLWGMGRVISLEHPQLWGGLVDLDPQTPESETEALLQLLADNNQLEDHLALRGEQTYIPRLVKQSPTVSPPVSLESNATYLITGGLGALGLHTAKWMVEKGARHLVLISRTQPSKDKLTAISNLQQQGAEVVIAQGDVCNFEELSKVFEQVDSDLAPLKGIVHAAGVVGFQPMEQMELTQLEEVMAAKVIGGWILHQLTQDKELDFFVSFSSIAAVWGAAGQAHYAASNHFLDGLSHYRRAKGLASLSINWGPWSGGGMGGEQELKELSKRGIKSLSPEEGIAALEQLWTSGNLQIAVANINWSLFKQLYEIGGRRLLLKEIEVEPLENQPSSKLSNSQPNAEILQQIEASSPREREKLLITHLQREVTQVLGMRASQIDVQQPLNTMGLDSLMAVELRNRFQKDLGVDVPIVKFIEDISIVGLATEVNGQLTQIDRDQGVEQDNNEQVSIIPAPENKYQPFPLTDIQQAYWVGRNQNFYLGNIATHGYIEIDCSDLDILQLKQAWQKLIEHHDMLRAVVLASGEQQILEQVPAYEIEVLDLRSSSPSAIGEQLEAIRQRLSHEILPSEQWPLFKIRATRLDEERTRIHLSLDALMADAWSIRLMIQQWQQLYENPQTVLPPLEISFRDYVLSELLLKDTAKYQQAQKYWFNRDLPPAPELPFALHPSAVTKPLFKRHTAQLETCQWQQLKQRATTANLTPTAVLLTAFADILNYWSQSPKFTINLTLFNRFPLHPQVNQLVGDFTSLTLLEVDHSIADSFTSRAQRLQKQLWQDLDHNYVSGVEVQRELRRQRSNTQPMGVVFTSTLGLNTLTDNTSLNQLGEVVYSISQTPQVWLDNQVVEEDGALVFNWDVLEELFPEGLIEDMFATYCNWLQKLANTDTAWEETHPQLLPPAQLAQHSAVNNTSVPISQETLHGLFQKQVTVRSQSPAVITPQQTLTYQELYQLANSLGHRLRQLGATPNTIVAVIMEKGWEQIVAVLGILMSGAAYLPISPEFPQERQWYLLEVGQVQLVVTQPQLEENLSLPEGIECLSINQKELNTAPKEPIESVQTPDDLAYVIYTSGSTGNPKGVMIDHKGAVNTILDINLRFGVGVNDRVLALSALSFDLSVYDIFGMLAAGGAIVMPSPAPTRRKDPGHWLELINTHQVTLWNTVPALMQMLIEHLSGRTDQQVGNLRLALLSGDWLPVNLPSQIQSLWSTIQVISLGGATEASIWSILYPIEKVEPNWKSIPYGKPMDNQRFYVLNQCMQPTPTWVSGELYIGGIGLAKGYWQDEEKTKNSFITDPVTEERLYKTGDNGRYLPNGDIEFLGREDFQVKINGYRIELGEIESALKQHPAVKEAVVNSYNNKLVAYLIPDQGLIGNNLINPSSASQPEQLSGVVLNPIEAMEFQLKQPELPQFFSPQPEGGYKSIYTEMHNYLKQKLPSYMVPNECVILETLPLTANGKVDRKALPIPDTAKSQSEIIYVAPRNSVEEQLAQIWGDLLEVSQVGIHDNFFELGGDSLGATRVISRIREIFEVDFPLQNFFEAPTVKNVAEYLEVANQVLQFPENIEEDRERGEI